MHLISANGWLKAFNGLMRLEMVPFVLMLYNVFLNSSSLVFFTGHVVVILDTFVVSPCPSTSERTVGKQQNL